MIEKLLLEVLSLYFIFYVLIPFCVMDWSSCLYSLFHFVVFPCLSCVTSLYFTVFVFSLHCVGPTIMGSFTWSLLSCHPLCISLYVSRCQFVAFFACNIVLKFSLCSCLTFFSFSECALCIFWIFALAHPICFSFRNAYLISTSAGLDIP